ncbi:MAG: hypothetical protein FXF47_02185 [Candidatus Mcinerneyibacterium aminivorans]|uniref:Uncharacterized protein n=1 Tax=Candidatus Mcinerneyibacterium aminivorans TaxID=2703815 RepID=A0A5D0MMK8_9BACT|nr:MAG: hypothetical protein FXF47_02185 [Candidatus Mcinerneyibacterium aminivorans]
MKKYFLFLAIIIILFSSFSQQLQEYEKKSLFIFPVQYSSSIKSTVIPERRKNFIEEQMFKMFVKDFQRIDFYEVSTNNSLDLFLKDAEQFIRENAKEIAAKRLDKDDKFKEAIVTIDDLIDTLYNSYAAVPVFEKIEKTKNKKDEPNFNIYLRFEIYNIDSKKKISTIKANNKTSLIGNLMSGLGGLQAESSIMKDLSKDEKEEDKKFQSSITGLFELVRTDMKKLKAFQIQAVPTVITSNRFGFDLGSDNGVKIDHRYKSYIYKSDGSRDMTAFGKIREVKKDYSEAEILIGDIKEGDQIVEDPKLGANFRLHYGMTKIKYEHIIESEEVTVVDELVPTVGVALDYDLGPITKIPEFYLSAEGRFVAIKNKYTATVNTQEVTVKPDFTTFMGDIGFLKKIYMKRFSLNFGAGVGVFSVTANDYAINIFGSTVYDNVTIKGTGYGFSGKIGGEFLITPEFSIYGNILIDLYSNPVNWTVESASGTEISGFSSKVLDINSQGIGFNAGISFTF